MTPPSLSERQCQFTHALAYLISQAYAQGFAIKIVELNRLLATQKDYVARGVSKTLDSRHLDNLAVDVVLYRDGVLVPYGEAYRPLGVYWESIGGRWGGRFGEDVAAGKIGWDPGHFEFTRVG